MVEARARQARSGSIVGIATEQLWNLNKKVAEVHHEEEEGIVVYCRE